MHRLNEAPLDPKTGTFPPILPYSIPIPASPPPHPTPLIPPPSQSLTDLPSSKHTEVVIAPPGLFLLLVREHLKAEIEVCSQNVFDKPNGAFTGEISAEQLADSKIGWALAGHSERRVILKEGDEVSGVMLGERRGKG